jgi:hypothetical protein
MLHLALSVAAALSLQQAAPPDEPGKAPSRAPDESRAPAQLVVDVDEARTRIGKGAEWLAKRQHPDGSWGSGAADSVQFLFFSVETYYAFQLGANSLAFLALLSVEPTPERDAALERSFDWLTASRLPKRGNDWDVDATWAALYGFQAMLAACEDPRFASPEKAAKAKARAMDHYALLVAHQEPLGGWGYYEGPTVSRRPTWSTSFATACVVPALVRAKAKGWEIEAAVVDRAVEYLRKCRLPNGAYSYDLSPIPWIGGETINDVKGSLGRIQVCNWARRRAGDRSVTDDALREGLAQFFEHHEFLDVARMRPIPHEAYYANAAYFYMFGHCYAAMAISELPEAERADWNRKLRAELAKIQWADGSSLDFPNMSCMQVAGTAFSVLALQAGLPGSTVRL